jgi:hypothetical protein
MRKARIFLAITAYVVALKRLICKTFCELFTSLRDVAMKIDLFSFKQMQIVNAASSVFYIPFNALKLQSTGVTSAFLRI